jgi:hypothetical protein
MKFQKDYKLYFIFPPSLWRNFTNILKSSKYFSVYIFRKMNNYQHILQKPGNLNFENNFLIEFKFYLIEYKL